MMRAKFDYRALGRLPAGQVCTVCSEYKLISEYYEYRRKKSDGSSKVCLYRHCKRCQDNKTKKWKLENPETTKVICKRVRAKRRDAAILYMKEWRLRNGRPAPTEEQKARRRQAVKSDPERFTSYRVRWISKPENRQKYNAWQANRRARERGAVGNFTANEWLAICENSGGRCLRCGSREPLTIDHIVPLSRGGSNTRGNIQPLCAPCNSAKGAQHIDYRWVVS